MECDKVRSDAAHRPHEQVVHREVDQRHGHDRDRNRDRQQVAGKPVHREPQRLLVDHDLDELPLARGPNHTNGVVVGLEHRADRFRDRRPRRDRAHVDVVIDHRRDVIHREQPALLAHLDRDRTRADALQHLPRQFVRDHAARRRLEHEGRGVRGGDAIVQPVHPEVRDRRHVDHDRGHQHERNGQQQQLARHAEPPEQRRHPRRRRAARRIIGSFDRHEARALFRWSRARWDWIELPARSSFLIEHDLSENRPDHAVTMR